MHKCIYLMTKKIKILKHTTYLSIIREAIINYGGIATLNDIFIFVSKKYPFVFKIENSNTWKGNIRNTLSIRKEFVKIKKKGNNKEHYWSYKEEEIENLKEVLDTSNLRYKFR